MKDWKGGIIAEGLSDPTIINKFAVYKATITKDNMPIEICRLITKEISEDGMVMK